MDFAYSDVEESVRDLAKELARNAIDDERTKKLMASGDWFDGPCWQALAETELLGLGLSEPAGGAEQGCVALSLLLQQLGRRAPTLPLVESLAAAMTLDAFGNDNDRAQLRAFCSGDLQLGCALHEESSSDLRAPKVQFSGGLYGCKTAVPEAELLLVSALGDDGPCLVLLDGRDLNGAAQRSTQGQPRQELELHGEAARPVGGPEVLRFLLDRLALLSAAYMLGLAQGALFMTSRYVSEREQFGQPLGAFQAVGQRAADAFVDTQAMELSLLEAAWRMERGLDHDQALASARYFACEGGHRVVAAAQHLHGGMGFDRDYPLYRHFLQMKWLEFSLGGARSQLQSLGDLMVEEA